MRWLFAASALALVLGIGIATDVKDAPRGRVVITETEIEILDTVRFLGTDTIATRSLRTLDALARTLEGNPSIRLVEVQANSQARADACRTYLIGQGIAPERLATAVIAGDVAEFLIVDRQP